MAPKKPPSNRSGTPPTTRAVAPPSQRGDAESQRGLPKKKSKKSLPNPIQEESALEPLDVVLAPLVEILEGLRGEMINAVAQLAIISPSRAARHRRMSEAAPIAADAPASSAAADDDDERTVEEMMKKRKQALRVWQSFAAEKLSQMASSLAAALATDAKLRELFNKIDLDLGGTIDQSELYNALQAAGKNVKPETVAEMFNAADYDGGGDIDYSEFADVIKGVKVSNAGLFILSPSPLFCVYSISLPVIPCLFSLTSMLPSCLSSSIPISRRARRLSSSSEACAAIRRRRRPGLQC